MMEDDLALLAEEACLAGWPAPREVLLDGWLLRFAGGHTRRANSVNAVGPSRREHADKIAACEALYRAQSLQTVFRLSTAIPQPGLAPALDAAGYGPPEDESLVLFADLRETLRETRRAGGAAAELTEGQADALWLAATAALGNLDGAATVWRARIFEALVVPSAFAAVTAEGVIVAAAFGAVHGGIVCVNGVATAPQHRGRGLAGRAVGTILDWAAERAGATGACLPVVAGNAPALALYRRLGFKAEVSRYHYRRLADP